MILLEPLMMIKYLLILLTTIIPFFTFGQTSPEPYVLVGNPDIYLSGYTDGDDINYPPGFQGWLGVVPLVAETDPTPTDIQATGDGNLDPSSTDPSAYFFRNAEDLNISFRGNNSEFTPLALMCALDTRQCEDITIYWFGKRAAGYTGSGSAVQTQYRIGTSGEWTNLGPRYSYISPGQTADTEIGPLDLPEEAEEQEIVQIRWLLISHFSSGTINATNGSAIDEITISAGVRNLDTPKAEIGYEPFPAAPGEPTTLLDLSYGPGTEWQWFVEDTVYTSKNPQHIFDENGTYSIKLIVSNSLGIDSTTESVFVAESGVPITINDSATAEAQQPIDIFVLENDTIFNATIDTSSLAIVDMSMNGTTTVNSETASISYTSEESFQGIDSFSYMLCNDEETPLCDTAKVFVTVETPEIVAENLQSLFIYPNPVRNELSIEFDKMLDDVHVSIFNSSGILAQSNNITISNSKINISMLPAGIYLLTIQGDFQIYKQTLVVQ